MKYTATKYFRAYDDTWEYYHHLDTIQKQCQKTLETGGTEELCSTTVLNNCTFSNLLPSNLEKIQELPNLKETEKDNKKVELNNSKPEEGKLSETYNNAFERYEINAERKKNYFQDKTRKALENSQIEEAKQIIEKEYLEEQKRKFIRFLDTKKGEVIIAKQLCRFDPNYILRTKHQIKNLERAGLGCDIQHTTLTLPHTSNENCIEEFRKLKENFHKYVNQMRRLIHRKELFYICTYETTIAENGQYHQHLHFININIGYLQPKILIALREYWKKLTGSTYIHFNYIPKDRNLSIFSYIMKYISKEISTLNNTSVLLFSVKGKAYSISLPLKKLMLLKNNNQISLGEHRFKFLDFFYYLDVFIGYDETDYNPCSLTYFYTFLSAEEKNKVLSDQYTYMVRKKQLEREEKEAKEATQKITFIKIK